MWFFNKNYMCHKCGRIEFTFRYPEECPVCGNKMQPIQNDPRYVLFEKSDEVRKQIPPEEIDPQLWEKRLKYEEEEINQIAEELAPDFEKFLLKERSKPVVACPYCKSTNTTKISAMTKATRYAAFGVLAVGANSKQWHCNNCNSNF